MNARELSHRLADLLRNERNALAEFLLALADFDRERQWVELGHRSLFAFLARDLGLSKGAAFYRMTAAQLVRRHPEVIEPLRDGRLCLTNVVELSKVLTAENLPEILPRFLHLAKLEAKQALAELSTHAGADADRRHSPSLRACSGQRERRADGDRCLPLSRGSAPNHVHANAAVTGVASARHSCTATPTPGAFERRAAHRPRPPPPPRTSLGKD
jgi:hypothetical protein